MRVVFVVNAVDDLKARQTTALLVHGSATRGHETWLCGTADLELDSAGAVVAVARPVRGDSTRDDMLRWANAAAPQRVSLEPGMALFIRTNPARDKGRAWAHETLLDLARVARDHGVVVVNDPDGLARAGSKLYLMELPERMRPVTAVLRSKAAIQRFVDDAGARCVLKPLRGTQGQDVFLVGPGEPNLSQIVDVLTRAGHVMAQHFVPEARDGDIRLVLLDGVPLQVGDVVAAVRRVPAEGDFRSNISQGGQAQRAEMTPALWEVARATTPLAQRDGLFLVGLDLIGDKVVEVNVFSPGGLGSASDFLGVDFIPTVLAALERRVARVG